jgi:Fic family protein
MYIHLSPNWPQYKFDAEALLPMLEEANRIRGQLFGTLDSLAGDGAQERELSALVDGLVKSSAIEGESLDIELVRSSVARRLGTDTAGILRTNAYIDGLVEMALDAAHNYDTLLTPERIFRWHASIFPSARNAYGPVRVGAWRSDEEGSMVVASKKAGREVIHLEAPEASRLDHEMTVFLEWVNGAKEKSLLLKAGIAHLWFETLHPLDDGNGRVGRNIMDYLLARADQRSTRPYSVSSYMHRERDAYYTELERAQKGSLDFTPWLAWFLQAFTVAVKESMDTIEGAVFRTKFWESVSDLEINSRQKKALSRMLMGWEGRMTNKKYASLTRCSDATATRDLADLVAKQILKPDGRGGRSAGYDLRSRDDGQDDRVG